MGQRNRIASPKLHFICETLATQTLPGSSDHPISEIDTEDFSARTNSVGECSQTGTGTKADFEQSLSRPGVKKLDSASSEWGFAALGEMVIYRTQPVVPTAGLGSGATLIHGASKLKLPNRIDASKWTTVSRGSSPRIAETWRSAAFDTDPGDSNSFRCGHW
jgi:hypothetical protein